VQKVWQSEGVKLPSKRNLEKKNQELLKLTTQPMTEVGYPIIDIAKPFLLNPGTVQSDVTAMLARKNGLNAGKHTAQSATMERSRLNQARTLALRRHDFDEVGVIDRQLAELPAMAPTREEEISDMLAKVNERNRKANLDAVRKSEIHEVERKRRDRQLQAAARASGTSTPVDPSARLRTVPKLFNSISRFVSVYPSIHPDSVFCSVSFVDFFLPLRFYCCAGQERRSPMGEHRCSSLNGQGLQRDRYLRYHLLCCQGVCYPQTNPRHSRRASLMRLKSILGISENSMETWITNSGTPLFHASITG